MAVGCCADRASLLRHMATLLAKKTHRFQPEFPAPSYPDAMNNIIQSRLHKIEKHMATKEIKNKNNTVHIYIYIIYL